jgi:Mg/Co/Ni transporter MgtE
MDVLKSGSALHATVINEVPEISIEDEVEVIEEMDTEEVTSFAEIMPVSQPHFTAENHDFESIATSPKDKSKRFITRRTV